MSEGARTVLVVEDDAKIAALLGDYLAAAGFQPVLVRDGAAALARAERDAPAAILLDWMLPGMDGLSICRALRRFCAAPVLMLTARVEEQDRLAGLEGGADDYVCKPFSAREVVARVQALVRRAEGRVTAAPPAQGHAIDPAGRRIAWRGQWLPLSPGEYAIAATLMGQPGRIFSRDQLLDRLGERAEDSSDRAIDSHVKNIRRKIAAIDPAARCIVAVYGAGYRFDP